MSPDYDLEREILQLEQRYAENAHGLVFAHLADAYRKAGEYAKAEGLLLHGLKTHPSYTSAYNVLGRVYIDSERFEDAQAQFARVLELDPQNLISLRALGDLAAQRGQADDARGWYQRMLQVDPRSEEAREGLARLGSTASGAAETPAPEPAEPEPEPAEPETAVGGFVPGAAGVELPDMPTDRSAEEWAAVAEESGGPDEPSPLEIEDRDLETVEKVKADFEPLEGLIGEEGMYGVSMDEIVAQPDEPGAAPIEDHSAEPWEVDSVDEPWIAEQAELGEHREESAAGADEPWIEPAGTSANEESAESTTEEAEPWLMAESESLELPSMDDWSPGFVVGELLEGQAAEELRPEEILEGLDAEYTFEAPEEPEEEPDWAGTSEDESKDESKDEGVVTETMAELYASQGLYSDALAVYQRLAEASPDDERLQSRILDLQQRIEEAGLTPDEEELVRLMKLTEPEEEAPSAATIDETVPESASEFEFEDQAPFAGFDQLDPFAASFDTLAAKTHSAEPFPLEAPLAEEEPAEGRPEAETVEPLESEGVEGEPIPVESLAEEPAAEDLVVSTESPEAGPMGLGSRVDESAAEVVAEEVTEEIEYAAGDEGITAVDSIWELTEVGAPGREFDETSEPSDEVEVPVRIDGGGATAEPREPSSMEDYIAALLAFDVERLSETSASSSDSQEDKPPQRPESPNAEDLEQFQDWLRSLKR